MPYTLTQAAEATGKSKSTILRSIQGGRVSAARDDLTQGWMIEPSELHRLYPPVASDAMHGAHLAHHASQETRDAPASLVEQIAMLREMLAERDRRVADKDGVITDLRVRLDAEAEERRRTQAQLTGLLTDQRTKPEPEKPRRRWWEFGNQA